MKLKHTKNLKFFKKEVGQANHFLITLLIGLEQVNENTKESETLNASWNPKNKMASVHRSRNFVEKASLVWIVDNIDAYLRKCNEKPKILPENLIKKFDTNGRSVYRNFIDCREFFKNELEEKKIECAMVDLIICWRNRLTHYNADNDILPVSKEIFKENRENIFENYRHLNIEDTLVRFYDFKEPTFKEITSMIRACIDLIKYLDFIFINKLNTKNYTEEILKDYFSRIPLENVFSKDVDTKKRKIMNIFREYGFVDEDNLEMTDLINEKVKLNYQTAMKFYLTK